MKTPLGSAVPGAETTLPFSPAAKRPSMPGEGKFYRLEPTRFLRVLSLSFRSWLGTDPARLLMRTGRERLSQSLDALLMSLASNPVARRQQKVFRPFGYSIKTARERRSYWSTAIACIAGLPTTTTPPDTKHASLQITVPYTSDLAAIEFARPIFILVGCNRIPPRFG